MSLQQGIYQALIRLLAPIGLVLGGRQDPGRWRERLGCYPAWLPKSPIWIHAASVGEARAAALLMVALRQAGETGPFVVSTSTRTGSESIRPLLSDQDAHIYAPLDHPRAVRRALNRLRPRALVVMEVEIWPNLWATCEHLGIPLILANGRLSARSLERYQSRLPGLWRKTLARARLVLAQSEEMASRYQALGVAPERLRVAGNLKFSLVPDAALIASGLKLRKQLGRERPVWLAASTHETEEALALEVHQQLLRDHPDLLLVVAPRHPQRFNEVARLCEASSLAWQRRSHDPARSVDAASVLYLADTLGELLAFYAAADLCWVAGSFVPVGGHNVLEPAAYGCPAVVGPQMRNFAEISAQLSAAGGLVQVGDRTELASALAGLLATAPGRQRQAEAARRVLDGHAGAAALQAREIQRVLVSL